MMTNGDCEGQIYLPHPHTNNGLSLNTIIFIFKKRLQEVLEYTAIQHNMLTGTLANSEDPDEMPH